MFNPLLCLLVMCTLAQSFESHLLLNNHTASATAGQKTWQNSKVQWWKQHNGVAE